MRLSNPWNTCSPPDASHPLSWQGGHCAYLPRVLVQSVRSGKHYHVHLPSPPASYTASALGTCLGLQIPSNFPRGLLQENMYTSVVWRYYKSSSVHGGFLPEMTGLPSWQEREAGQRYSRLLTQSPPGPSRILSQVLH